jgi:hypothetical protein
MKMKKYIVKWCESVEKEKTIEAGTFKETKDQFIRDIRQMGSQDHVIAHSVEILPAFHINLIDAARLNELHAGFMMEARGAGEGISFSEFVINRNACVDISEIAGFLEDIFEKHCGSLLSCDDCDFRLDSKEYLKRINCIGRLLGKTGDLTVEHFEAIRSRQGKSGVNTENGIQ